jgi:hypothetical protein
MPDGTLYHDDFHAWALEQADRLRAASQVQAPELDGIDFEHVIEEVEDLGLSERRQVSGNLSVALQHMIKIAALPEADFVRGWRGEVVSAIRNARRAFTPSMRQRLDLPEIWSDAREDALQNLAVDGIMAADIPEACPMTLDRLLGKDMGANDLIDIMIAAMPR